MGLVQLSSMGSLVYGNDVLLGRLDRHEEDDMRFGDRFSVFHEERDP